MNTNLNEIPQNWNFFSTRIDDNYASIRLNLALIDIIPIKTHSQVVWFSIKVQKPDEHGMPTNEEFQILNQIEDEIFAAVEQHRAIFAGVVTSSGSFDFYFYIQENSEEFNEICGKIMTKFPSYEYSFKRKEDPDWTEYTDFLYPNKYEYQVIMNRSVIYNLEKQGDNSDIERAIDHWLYLPTQEAQNEAVIQAEKLGFELHSKDKLDDENKYPYQIHLTKNSNTHLENINNDVWDLVDIAEPLGGYYDGWGCNIVK
ncbi:MAG: DUF695 domain-containing protein [Capnocytophaga sp.]|nr:DUF695 domain-containing protein [Capnocytophaga sp.]